jgi:hypothetical protein
LIPPSINIYIHTWWAWKKVEEQVSNLEVRQQVNTYTARPMRFREMESIMAERRAASWGILPCVGPTLSASIPRVRTTYESIQPTSPSPATEFTGSTYGVAVAAIPPAKAAPQK